jgi:hypothetical protein
VKLAKTSVQTRMWVIALSAIALMGGVAAAARPASSPGDAGAPPPPKREEVLRNPEYLPAEARALLRDRMARHGGDMTVLMAAVLMLNYEVTEELVQAIGREPKLTRPSPRMKDTLNSSLPSKFFDFQDLLAVRAKELASAAKAYDDPRLVKAYGRLAEVCVGCHSLYLRGAEESQPE